MAKTLTASLTNSKDFHQAKAILSQTQRYGLKEKISSEVQFRRKLLSESKKKKKAHLSREKHKKVGHRG